MTTTTVKLVKNIIILKVENLLQDWPTYVINFMVENTGPQRLILHLKNASKYVRIDSDDEDEAVVSEHHSDARIMVTTVQCNETAQYDSPGETSDEEEMPSSNEEAHHKVLLTTMHAAPVSLHGTPKEPAPLKCKTFDESWPPHCPCAFHKISPNSLIAMYNSFWTFPAAVRHVLEDISNGPAGENVKGNGAAKV
ncbi:hypothetical protein EDC04DRAFT_2606227 [Pisolithus marmoratus]|nr:hypothetical protein EDC04DRAFT_2606227 [Pisolithus marmoratus]